MWCNNTFRRLATGLPHDGAASIYDLLPLRDENGAVPRERHPATKAWKIETIPEPLGEYEFGDQHNHLEIHGARMTSCADADSAMLLIRDVTDQKRLEEQLSELAHFEELAHYDPVTGLPNRRLFSNLLDRALKRGARAKSHVALLILDIDRFKLINDTLGHSAGDQLLQAVATKLTRHLRGHELISRLGGDEFTVILEDQKTLQDVATIAQRILDVLSTPMEVAGNQIFTSVSIGISLYPADSRDSEHLVKNADTALYVAKEHRSCFRFFSSDMQSHAMERLVLNTELRQALQKEQFVLHYQPLLESGTHRIVGVEALIRWNHPTKGLLYPDKFIHAAEETGLIVPMGEWVLNTACAQIQEWNRQGPHQLRVAVNVASRQFQQSNLLDVVRNVLRATALPPHLLELELTERSLFLDTARTSAILEDLHRLGLSIAIDDFGTEYSSIGYLRRLPVHALKIDRSFVKEAPANSSDASIVKAIVAMAHCLNLKVIAEGVETEEHVNFLEAHACNELQGYYFSKPVRADEMSSLLQQGVGRGAIHR